MPSPLDAGLTPLHGLPALAGTEFMPMTGPPTDGYRGLSREPISPTLDKALRETLAKPITGRGRLDLTVATSGLQLDAAQKLGKGWVVGGWVGLARGAGREAGVRLSGAW